MDVHGAADATVRTVAEGHLPDTVEGGTSDDPDLLTATQRRLAAVADLPLEQRPAAFEAVHDDLRAALAEIDDA